MPVRAEIPAEVRILGLARIARIAFGQGNLRLLFTRLAGRLQANRRNTAALIDLATILNADGHAEPTARFREDALKLRRSFATIHGDGTGPRILALVTAGGFMANTPADFLLEGSNAVLWQHHVDEAASSSLVAAGDARSFWPYWRVSESSNRSQNCTHFLCASGRWAARGARSV